MSKANSPVKVLRTALKRVQTRWGKGAWSRKGPDGKVTVCLEGAIFGFCERAQTDAQREAHALVLGVIQERAGLGYSIPGFNDSAFTTQEDAEEVVKLALIRAESGFNDPEDEIDPDEVDSLLQDV